MANEVITKHVAADRLLQRAIRLHLDEHDHVCALLLAAAAEDLLAEVIDPDSLNPDQVTAATSTLHPTYLAGAARDNVRAHYNWLKHSAGSAAAEESTFDPEDEARQHIDRAIDNYWTLYNSMPPEGDRWDAYRQSHSTPEPEGILKRRR